MSFATTGRIHVTRLFLMETGRYDVQFRRPYQTSLTGTTLNALTESIGGSKRFTPSQLAGVANQIISPSATPESTIGIANGWNERRLRFMMEVECKQLSGGSIIVTALGYTSHPGVIVQTSALDPQMEFYINSIISIRRAVERTPLGPQTYSHIVDNSHVIVDPEYSGAREQGQTRKMRPEDVYATMGMSHLNGLTDAYDARTVLDNKPVASKRSNSVAASYAANLLDNYTRANIDTQFGVAKEEDILDAARGYAQEVTLQMNPFFKALSTFRDGFVSNFFTWRDLQTMDPHVDQVTMVSMLGQTSQMASSQITAYDVTSGMASPWNGSDLVTRTAVTLSQSIPSIMTDYGLTVFSFVSTNRRVYSDAIATLGPFAQQNQVSTRVVDVQSFSNFDLTQIMDHFVSKVESMVFADISYNNEVDYFVEMRVDLLGETWIKISLDGGPELVYVTPSFADALFVPVVTTNQHLSGQLANDFNTIFHHLSEHHGMNYAMNQPVASGMGVENKQNFFGVV